MPAKISVNNDFSIKKGGQVKKTKKNDINVYALQIGFDEEKIQIGFDESDARRFVCCFL